MTQRLAQLWLLLAFAICAASVWGHVQIGLNNDQMAFMDQARKLLAGEVPYVDYTDVNPPLIQLLYVIPVTMAKLTGFTVADGLNLMTLALIGASLCVADRIIKSAVCDVTTRLLVSSTLGLALMSASFIHQVFGDREHLMMVLAVPWLVLYSPLARREATSMKWRLAAALMAAVGFAIKPYFYLFYGATILWERYSGKPLRTMLREPEHWIVCGVAACYLAVVFIFFPQYPLTMIPVGWYTYGALHWDWNSKFGVMEKELLGGYAIPGLAAMLLLWLLATERYEHSLTYVTLLLFVGLASYAASGGWYYTQYPFIAMALVLVVLAGEKLIQASGERKDKILILSGILAFGLWHFFGNPAQDRAHWDMRLQRERGHTLSTAEVASSAHIRIEAALDSNPRFLFLGTSLWGVNFLKEGSPRRSVGRFDYLWLVPGILRLEGQPGQQTTYQSLFDYLSESIADDLKHQAPDLIINDVSPSQFYLPHAFNALDYIKKNQQFAEAWKDYILLEKVDACVTHGQGNCAYELYIHKH